MSLSGKPIVVLGMHRSGTSSVANALAHMGVFMGGERDLVVADRHNEAGYWEHKDILELNGKCLVALGMAFDRVGPMPTAWREFPATEPFLREMESLLGRHYDGRAVWGWKEPLTTVLVPFYNEVFKRAGVKPHYVICARNPLDVAASLMKRDQLPETHALGLWLRYTLCALKESIGHSRSVVIYHSLLNDSRAVLKQIADSVEGWDPDEASLEAGSVTVRPDLNHSQRPLKELDGMPSILRRTYELCCDAASDSQGLNGGNFDGRILELWSELVNWVGMIADLDPPPWRLLLFWPQDGKAMRADCPFVPIHEWQTLRVPVNAAPGTTITAMIYNLPSAVWLRNPKWRREGKEIPAALKPGRNAHLEREFGVERLWTAPGPNQLMLNLPTEPGPYEFEVEVLLESNHHVTGEFVVRLDQELGLARQRVAELDKRAGDLETKANQLARELKGTRPGG